MLQLKSVMSMPTARILLVLIFVRAKLDTVEMEKHAKVDKNTVYLSHEVCKNVISTSELTNRFLRSIMQSLTTSKKLNFCDYRILVN